MRQGAARFGSDVSKFRKAPKMNNGDVIVCGVSEDKLVEDISILVPKGDAVTVPGHLAHRSKDLWRLLSQGVIFQLNANSLLRLKRQVEPPPVQPNPKLDGLEAKLGGLEVEVGDLRSGLLKSQSEKSSLQAENRRLSAEVLRLQGELAGQALDQSKLDAILHLVKSRPQVVNVVSESRASVAKPLDDVDGSAPMFIPSQIKSDSVGGQVAVKEGASDAASLSDASKALKGMRRKT